MTAVETSLFDCFNDRDKRSTGVSHFKFGAQIDHKNNNTLRNKYCFYINNYKESDNSHICSDVLQINT